MGEQMPLYEYLCNACKQPYKTFHGADEVSTECVLCSSPEVSKKLPSLNIVESKKKTTTAGQRVEKFIEDSREALKEQLAEARKDVEL
jgi:putative FmdB family regulatory protein